MEICVQSGAIQDVASDLIVVNLFQGVEQPSGATGAVDAALGGAIRDVIASGDFQGKAEQVIVLYTRGAIPARRVMVVGLGPQDQLDLDVVRRAAAISAREARKLGVRNYHSIVHSGGAGSVAPQDAAQAVVEGSILGAYRFTELKVDRADLESDLESLTLVEYSAGVLDAVRRGAEVGRIVGEAACYARDLVNRPANYVTPTALAGSAREMAESVGLTARVFGEPEMAELGMGALLGVAQGSHEPPTFTILEHNPQRQDLPAYVIVGKGITFDSGGISIKPSEGMERMKDDMAGAAAVLGTMRAVAQLGLPLRVVGLVPATENLPGSRAYKPGDVLTSMSGLTIEVISTDAEGRLVLADALAYAARYHPRAVIDLATLTGACVVALGNVAAGLMSVDAGLSVALEGAGARTGDKLWRLPLFDEYAEQIKSDVADVKNVGGRPAGAITAGMFLKRFAGVYPWAHLDIAGTAWSEDTKGYRVKGATGFGVRLLVDWLRAAAAGQG